MFRLLLVALLCALCSSLPAVDKNPSAYTLAVATDRADCICRRGEPVTFTISVSLVGQSGEAKLTDGKATVTGKLDEPGFMQCHADHDAGVRDTVLAHLKKAGHSAPTS